MANLNFTRNIGGGGLGRSSVGFGASSMSGHVTPVFGQRAPPDRRGIPTLGGGNQMLGGGGGSVGGLSGGGGGAGSSYGSLPLHTVFGSGDTNTPPLLDLSEFPSLSGGGRGGSGTGVPVSLGGVGGGGMSAAGGDVPSLLHANSVSVVQSVGAKPYVGMVKQPASSEPSEFTMSSEDFPALPGTQHEDGGGGGGSNIVHGADGMAAAVVGATTAASVTSLAAAASAVAASNGPHMDKAAMAAVAAANGTGLCAGGIVGSVGLGSSAVPDLNTERMNDKNSSKSGIQTHADGRVTNIPASMVNDQFGIVGLLTFIRAAETDPNLVSLALGQDLTALGLNLNAPDNIYPTFGGPWADQPCRPQDIDFHVPPEYVINTSIRDKLAPVKLNRYKDDLLFFLFYNNAGDVLQVAAAYELYSREWRYHTEEKVWITQVPGMVPLEKTLTYERGTFYFFDAQNWRKVAKEFHLEYTKLEGRPNYSAASGATQMHPPT